MQPIIHREVAVPRVEQVEEHVTEHIREPTIHTREVKEEVKVLPTETIHHTQHVAAGGAPPVHKQL